MSSNKELIIDLIEDLPEEKIETVVDFIKFVKLQPTELDAYDYELAREAEKILKEDEESIPLDKVLEKLELTLIDIQDWI